MNDASRPPELDALFAQARADRADTSAAEYGFETRLLARIRERRGAENAWGWVAWRLAPVFGACVIGLAVWHGEISTQVTDAEQIASVEYPESIAVWNNLN